MRSVEGSQQQLYVDVATCDIMGFWLVERGLALNGHHELLHSGKFLCIEFFHPECIPWAFAGDTVAHACGVHQSVPNVMIVIANHLSLSLCGFYALHYCIPCSIRTPQCRNVNKCFKKIGKRKLICNIILCFCWLGTAHSQYLSHWIHLDVEWSETIRNCNYIY